jgi:hypothetical protein
MNRPESCGDFGVFGVVWGSGKLFEAFTDRDFGV